MAGDQGAVTSGPEEGRLDHPTDRGDFAAGSICLLTTFAGAFIAVPIWVYVPDTVAGTPDSPAVMPLLMLGLIGLLGALLLIQTWRVDGAEPSHRTSQDWLRAGGMIAVCAGYLFLILAIGLPLATAVSLGAAMLYFGERRWALMLPVAIVTPLLLWAFFAYVAQVPMPRPMLQLGGSAAGNEQVARLAAHCPTVRS